MLICYQLVHDASKAAGVIPADVAGDLAANTEKFAEYGKDGGKNMIQAFNGITRNSV